MFIRPCLFLEDYSLLAFAWPISLVCNNSVTTQNYRFFFFQEKGLKVSKCYTFLWVQRRHNCRTEDIFANCLMTLYLLKVHLKTFLSIPSTQKCQTLICDTLVANDRYGSSFRTNISAPKMKAARSTVTLVCTTSHIRRLGPSHSTPWKPQIYSSSVLYLCQWQI